MTGLETVLARYDMRPERDGEGRPLAREALIEELRAIRQRTRRRFAACAVMLALVFAGAAALALTALERPGHLSMVVAAAGVASAWIIKAMFDLGQQKVAAELVLGLVGTLEPEVTRAVVGVVAAHLAGFGAAITTPAAGSSGVRVPLF
jgi:hypothetical protein